MRLSADDDLRALLTRVRRIAVVGLSSNPARPSHEVAGALQGFGYDIVPVNPRETVVLGETAQPNLAAVPGTVDMVDVFRRPDAVPDIVRACINVGVGALWLQEGVVHEAAAQRAADAGIDVVMDRCALREYRRLIG